MSISGTTEARSSASDPPAGNEKAKDMISTTAGAVRDRILYIFQHNFEWGNCMYQLPRQPSRRARNLVLAHQINTVTRVVHP